MKIHTKKLYNTVKTESANPLKKIPIRISIALSTALIIISNSALTEEINKPIEQDFVLTAYYSPLEGQCCYVKGGVIADRILNGEGHTTADGTAVYPGVVAAPGSYPFGTIIELPGYGVFKVHDRGGAIQEWDNGKHRLDLWVGFGEEGLARALQLGLKEVKGTIYYPGTKAPPVSFDYNSIKAPNYQLERFLVYDNLMAVQPEKGQSGLSVEMLQNVLHLLGYLEQVPTSFYGEQTEEALKQFNTDFKLDQPADILTSVTASYLLAAVARKDANLPISGYVNTTADQKTITEAQRILRSIGYYRGRTDGVYSDVLKNAIVKFQQDNHLVGTEFDPGAGQIGPITSISLQAAWNRMLVSKRAKNNRLFNSIENTLKQKGLTVESFLSEGNSGEQVTRLQKLLSELGYFEAEEVNGNFGPMTKQAVIQYQIDNSIVLSALDESAGTVGPKTLTSLQREQSIKHYKLVRSHGLDVL